MNPGSNPGVRTVQVTSLPKAHDRPWSGENMLPMEVFRNAQDRILRDHERRGIPTDAIQEVVRLDEGWREVLKNVEDMRRIRNETSRLIAQAKKSGDEQAAAKAISSMKNVQQQLAEAEKEEEKARLGRDALRMRIPNILDLEVPEGDGSDGNLTLATRGPDIEDRDGLRTHNELLDLHGWADLARGAKVTGSRFYFLKGDLAMLVLALQRWAIDRLTTKHGYELVIPPFMMNTKAYEGVVDLEDFETVMYGVEPDGYHLIATSEHPLTAMYSQELLMPEQLPIKMVGLSPCFRREVGAHGLSDRGIWRVHQFTKVEQIILCKPEDSDSFHQELLDNAIGLWDEMEIPYRVVDICTGDIGTVASRKYDIEVWMPAAGQWKEVVSCSNCRSYQAHRLSIRHRSPEGSVHIHTLNSTAIATSRALAAIIEHHQQEDGTISLPKALHPFLSGKVSIGKSI